MTSTDVTQEAHSILGPIQTELSEVEMGFFAGREHWPRPGWIEEFLGAFMRLREVDEYIEAEITRQDLLFQAEQKLRHQREYLLWLVRRIGKEVFFRAEIAMERALRKESADRAHRIYLRLIEIQDLEQDFLQLTDGQLLKRLSEGCLEQYRDLVSAALGD